MPLAVLGALGDLTSRTGGTSQPASRPDDEALVTGVTLDSRSVLPGDLYAALPGFNVHGARFAADAVRSGAVAVLTDAEGLALVEDAVAREGLGAVPVLVAADPRAVLGEAAATVYGRPSEGLTMIGVTGTNGKTTTAYLVESALRAHGSRTGLIGTVETRIGEDRVESVRTTPEATDLHALLGVMRERGTDACVMEVSSHALELHRVDGVVYDVALFTNLSQDHLDFHPSMEAYFAAKASLFTPERSRAGVVCVDDAWGARLAREAGVPVTTLSTTAISDGTDATDGTDWTVEEGDAGAFTLRERATGRGLALVSHLPGHFNVANTALAALALLATGLTDAEVEAAMAAAPDVPGRMEVVAPGGDGTPRCVVDFAHTPDAVDAALAALRPSTQGRLIAVLGAGGDRDSGKRPAMGAAAARRADVVVVTDDNPRSEDPATIRAAVAEGARSEVAGGAATAVQVIDGGARSSAIAEAIALAVVGSGEPGDQGEQEGRVDTVVVLGKGHEKGQEILGVKHPFDDRDAVRAALAAVTSTRRATARPEVTA
ncbi:UDP-N-acetylmuramoyl-L-alanyl-D-glutamate--2,6-diaminopimelate ligase [Intrasporangium flavum]|uniref:UDP-N-acetylmuramoyl-L-alanyl-D-glutamate--2, 6-diaminopimelate ligase n=1 Tax=Intrasporangium flavum TaxID=1428657 RepID=UPI001F60F375|nr:UDP-N-acetylmuramoyl-L-alanyl-D-glutamate--2,6-diaminopimelate ligase [Intrasporangium flavum]